MTNPRASEVSKIRINAVIIYLLVSFIVIWIGLYESPSKKIQKAQSYHAGFDLFIILSTFVQWQSLTTLAGLIAIISLFIDTGYFALMALLISKCAGEYQNAC